VRVVNEGGVVHRVLQPVEAPAGWTMFERVGLAAAAMPMARMSLGGLQSAEPFGSRVAGRPLGKADARLGAVTGRVGPGRSRRRRSGGFAAHPLGGADLAPYRRRAAQLATLLERDRPLPRLGPDHPGMTPGPGALDPGSGADLVRRLGLVKVGVDALVADLASVDAVEEEVGPLRDLAARLAPLSRLVVPAGVELERLRERALAVLRAFAAPAPGPEPGPEFWKR
jgi:Ca-activated chloride channel homolog